MKKFNINDYRGKYAMHCKTEEEAKDFRRVMHKAGRKWIDHTLYTKVFNWSTYKEKTAYLFNEGRFGPFNTAENEGYTILNWSDFMQHEFTKADLRDGMVGIDRSDERYIFLCGKFRNADGEQYWGDDHNLNEDFTSNCREELDFMRICTSTAEVLEEWCDENNLTTIWQRPEVTVMTMDEIKEKLGITGELKIKEV